VDYSLFTSSIDWYSSLIIDRLSFFDDENCSRDEFFEDSTDLDFPEESIDREFYEDSTDSEEWDPSKAFGLRKRQLKLKIRTTFEVYAREVLIY
jgi:hypothetical protein